MLSLILEISEDKIFTYNGSLKFIIEKSLMGYYLMVAFTLAENSTGRVTKWLKKSYS